MADQPPNHGHRTHRPHQGLLFFGGHTRKHNQKRVVPQQAWTNEPEPQKVKESEKKPFDFVLTKVDPFTDKKNEDPFTKKVVEEVEEAKPEKLSCFGRILQSWADDDSILRLSWMSGLAVIISLIGAVVFYYIERNTSCKWNVSESLWFVNTISTTIGYGTLYPCSTAGRIASVVYACIGIPINVVALSDVGKLLSRFLRYLWARIKYCFKSLRKRCKRKKQSQLIIIDKSTEVEVDEPVPLTMAMIVTLLWFVASSAFFCLTEPANMGFLSALYFVMISVTTIGFGDVTPKDYDLVVIHYFFIIIGIALFSMVINIIQDKVDSMNDHVEALISKEYAKAQEEGIQLQADDEKAAREHVKNIIKKQNAGGLLRLVMGKNMENRLVDNYLEKARKVGVVTQTDNDVHDREIMAVPLMSNHIIQVSRLPPNAVNIGTQLKWVPTYMNPRLDYLDLNHRSSRSSNRSVSSSERVWRI